MVLVHLTVEFYIVALTVTVISFIVEPDLVKATFLAQKTDKFLSHAQNEALLADKIGHWIYETVF